MTLGTLREVIDRQFEIENLGALEEDPMPSEGLTTGPMGPDKWTPEEKLADALMTVSRQEGATGPHFGGRIPWREGHQFRLWDNAQAVITRQDRTHSTESLRRKWVEPKEIDTIVDGYLKKGYIEPVPPLEEHQGWSHLTTSAI